MATNVSGVNANSSYATCTWFANVSDCLADFGHGDDHAATLIRTSLIGVIGAGMVLVTVFGNLLVLIAFGLDKSIRSISNYFILSLAIADVIIGVISMPLYTVYILMDSKWVFGRFMCKLWLSVDYTVSNASVGNLLVICCDRYLSITRPLTYRAGRTRRKAVIMIVVAWSISAILWTPWIFAWPAIEGEERVPEDDCYIQFLMSKSLQTQVITIVTAVCAFYAPVTLMCILYMRVYYETRKRRKALGRLQAFQRAARGHTRKSVTSINATTCEQTAHDDAYTQLSSEAEQQPRSFERLKPGRLSIDYTSAEDSFIVKDVGVPQTPKSSNVAATPLSTNGLCANGRAQHEKPTYRRSSTEPSSNRHSTNELISSRYSAREAASKKNSVSRRSTEQSAASFSEIALAGLSLTDAGLSRKPSAVSNKKSLSVALSDYPAYSCQLQTRDDSMMDDDRTDDGNSNYARLAKSCSKADCHCSALHRPDGLGLVASHHPGNCQTAQNATNANVEKPSNDGKHRTIVSLDQRGTSQSSLRLLSASSRSSVMLHSSVNCAYSAKVPPLDARALALDSSETVSRTGSIYHAIGIRKIPARRADSRHDKGDSKALKTLAAILLAFIITWSPYNLFTIMNLCCDCVQGWLYILGYYLCYINSTINPLCYALCNTQFRRAFYKIMKCVYCKKRRHQRNSMRLTVRK